MLYMSRINNIAWVMVKVIRGILIDLVRLSSTKCTYFEFQTVQTSEIKLNSIVHNHFFQFNILPNLL